MTRTFLQLGCNGDIINLLPALKWHADQIGDAVNLIVDANYANLLDGCSYVHPIVFPHRDYRAVGEARRWAQRMGYKRVIVTQTSGRDWRPRHVGETYAQDSRNRTGAPDSAWDSPVLFDRRNSDREIELVNRFVFTGRPIILFSGVGNSSPFKDHDECFKKLYAGIAEYADCIDISYSRAKRLYDLLGLYERAACLVTIDTATLHIAGATPRLPVVALISDRFGSWSGTVPMKTINVVASAKYSEWREKFDALADALHQAVIGPSVAAH